MQKYQLRIMVYIHDSSQLLSTTTSGRGSDSKCAKQRIEQSTRRQCSVLGLVFLWAPLRASLYGFIQQLPLKVISSGSLNILLNGKFSIVALESLAIRAMGTSCIETFSAQGSFHFSLCSVFYLKA